MLTLFAVVRAMPTVIRVSSDCDETLIPRKFARYVPDKEKTRN